MLEQTRDTTTPRAVGQEVWANAAEIVRRWLDGTAAFIPPLHALSQAKRAEPIFSLLECLERAGLPAEQPNQLISAVDLSVATRHGQERAALVGYSERYLHEEYSQLRRAIMEHWRVRRVIISCGTMWLHRQLDLLSSSALTAFETVRHHHQASTGLPVHSISDARFSPLIGGRGDPIWTCDVATGTIQWGEELETAYGYPAACRSGPWQWWIERIHPDDRALVLEELQVHAAAQVVSFTYHYRLARYDGTYAKVRHRIYRTFDHAGRLNHCVGLVVAIEGPLLTDDPDTKKCVSRARPDPQTLKPLPSSLALIDRARRFVYANQALLDYWGYSLEALQGKRVEEIVGEEASVCMRLFTPDALRGSVVSFELPVRSPRGEARWHLLSYLPYRNGNKAIQGVVAHVLDLHAFVSVGGPEGRYHYFSRQYQCLLGELQHLLQAPVAAAVAHAQAEARVNALEQQRQAREHFVTMLAHDLRNPLTAAKMTVERLAKKIDATSQSKRMMVSRLAAQIDRTDQMVSNLLDTNRIEGGQKLIVHPRNIDLGATLVDVVSDFLPGQERIRLNLPSEPVRGFGDPNALRRIVENLLSNAVKYGDSHQPITLTLEDVSFGPRIEVHNWGQPLPKEGREALFRPFVRAPEAVQSAQPGWGVGLALVRALAEAHGGHVSLQSTASRGTTFAVTLPRAT